MATIFSKSNVPRPVTCGAQNQPTSKMKRYKSGGTNGIPSRDGRESISVAARVRTRYDVVEALKSVAVQPEIEETERGPAVRNKKVIN